MSYYYSAGKFIYAFIVGVVAAFNLKIRYFKLRLFNYSQSLQKCTQGDTILILFALSQSALVPESRHLYRALCINIFGYTHTSGK